MGPGTASHRELPAWYLPMQGRGTCRGAAVIDDVDDDPTVLAHAQALCNQMGVALQRAHAAREEAQVRERAQTQEVRNTLLAAIAHDYRTPLATIVGAASSLHEQSARLNAEQSARLAGTVLQEMARLSRMTDNTLQLARLDADGLSLRCDWESAEELVGAVLRRARERAPQRSLRARLEPGLPLLWCDAILLSQLLDNLIDNALKYSPEDAPVELLVRRRWRAGDAGGARPRTGHRASLAGTGVSGLPARRRSGDARHRRGAGVAPGVGVGLAVCRAIARVHGGELRLRARGHGGCSFECLLPVTAAPAQPDDRAAAVTLRVLLVEDDRDLRATLRDALSVEGHEVLTAASLSEGMALLAHARNRLDLVLLDLGLPDGDGEALLATLRRDRNWPVLVISARDATANKIRLLDAGADDYLVKPFSVGELLARMRVALRHRGTALQPAVTHYRHGGRADRRGGAARARDGAAGAPDAHRIQAAGHAGAPAPGRW